MIRTGMRTGRGVPVRRFQVKPWMLLIALFALGAGLGLALRELPTPTEIGLEWTLAKCGGQGCRVSVVSLSEGRLAVGVGVPRNARLSPAAAEALVKTELRLGPADTLAVVTLPDTAPAPPLLEVLSLGLVLAGLTLTVRRYGPGLQLWWKARRAPRPEPEPEVEPTARCVVMVSGRGLSSLRAAVAGWRRAKVHALGVAVCPIAVVPGPEQGVRIDGETYATDGEMGDLLSRLDDRLVYLIGMEQVSQLLERWRPSHPGVVGELTRRVKLERLVALVREWLRDGNNLKNFDVWAEHLLAHLDRHSHSDLLGAVSRSLKSRHPW